MPNRLAGHFEFCTTNNNGRGFPKTVIRLSDDERQTSDTVQGVSIKYADIEHFVIRKPPSEIIQIKRYRRSRTISQN